MKVPLSWLRDFVDLTLEPRALAARLTMAGVEVEAVHEVGAEWENVYVGYVEHVVGVRDIAPGSLRTLPPLLSGSPENVVASIGTLDAQLLLVLHAVHLLPKEAA